MGAVSFLVTSRLARRWKATLGAALLVGLLAAAVLTLAAGARRTATAPDRLTRASGGDGALVTQEWGPPRTAEIATLPSVQDLEGLTFVALGFRDAPSDVEDVNTFAGTGISPAARLVEGRLPDMSRQDEFVGNEPFARAFHAHVGDQFAVAGLTQDQLDQGLTDADPQGPAFTATMVGLADSPDDLDDPTPTVVFPTALLGSGVGLVSTLWSVHLRPGATLADLRADLDSLPDGTDLGLDRGRVVSDNVRTSVDAQAKGLAAIALASAVASLVALGYLLGRLARRAPAERRSLGALGVTQRQLLADGVARAVPALIGGMILAMVGAALASGIFPAGFARHVEPRRGVRPDWVVLGLGSLIAVVVLSAWIAIGLWLAARHHAAARPSGIVDAFAGRAPSPASAVGIRFGLRRHERDAVSAAGSTLGLTVAVVGILGAVVFASSLRGLVHDDARFGGDFDLVMGNGWYAPPTDLATVLPGRPEIGGLMLMGTGFARHGDDTVELVGTRSVQGGLAPRLLAGRQPLGIDEIALGTLSAHQLGVHIGDDVALAGPDGDLPFHVVGLAVVPSLGINQGLGLGGIVTLEALQALNPDFTVKAAAIVFSAAGRADAVAARERLRELVQVEPGDVTVPSPIVNLSRIQRIPIALCALLFALGSLGLVQVLVVAVRARRRDLAILRALGADRRQVRHIVHWQATVMALVPVLIGTVLGLIAGARVFHVFAARTGAVPTATVPVLAVVAIVAALVLVANLAAGGARATSARALALRTE